MPKSKCPYPLGGVVKSLMFIVMGLLIGHSITKCWYDYEMETVTIVDEKAILPKLLYNTTRVLCWVMTQPANHLTKAIHIRKTWGQRCHKLLFISTEANEELKTITLNVEEGRHNLWNKTKEALKYIYKQHFNEAEWFLKADDDTYVVMENLRYLLYQYPAEVPLYFGAKFKPFVKQGYMSGGAGYVLSKEALKKFAVEAYNDTEICPTNFKSEDVQLGMCLENVGVIAGDSRDCEGQERFIPLAVEHVIPDDTSFWYKKYTYYPQNKNESCCSSSAISFHYIQPEQFYILEYLIYGLRPFGIAANMELPKKLSVNEIKDSLENC
ncbi:hypothetical protein DOY81_003727 [Sarcophaga bullata]|nr:hypothetical protein DOY81_003727 [Sarcophaga bullata]